MRSNTPPAIAVVGVLVILILGGGWSDIASAGGDRDVTLLFACVDSCGIPPGWTVERAIFEYSDTWGDPWPCGEGMNNCPPGDPSNGWSFVCMPSPETIPYGPWDEWLISPSVDVEGVTSLRLQFLHRFFYWGFCVASNEILARSGDGPFVPVMTIECSDPIIPGYVYSEEIDLSEFLGQSTLQVAFRMRGQGNDWCEHWWVDDVRLRGAMPTPVEQSSWSAVKALYRP